MQFYIAINVYVHSNAWFKDNSSLISLIYIIYNLYQTLVFLEESSTLFYVCALTYWRHWTHLHSPTPTHSLRSLFCPVGEWRTVFTGVNSQLMRKSALVVEACPKWASARAGVNESIKSFNEGEARMKEGEEKGREGVLWRGGGSESAHLSEGRILI